MKKVFILLVMGLVTVACNEMLPQDNPNDAFAIEQPVPQTVLSQITLNETQQGYIREGNKLSFKIFPKLLANSGGSFVYSPLSLELALAMTANGTEGQTRSEILGALGYGSADLGALNEYARILIEQLPSLDLDVTLKLADALLATDKYTLKEDFRETLAKYYYAPAAVMPFNDARAVLNKVNDWAKRNTEGLIDPMLEDIDPNAVAFLLNALYFKAQWQGSEKDPMFSADATYGEQFRLADGKAKELPFMHATRSLPYADMGDYQVLALPYSSGKFYMYILLPKKDDGLESLVASLGRADWGDLSAGLREGKNVILSLPRFEVSGDFLLNDALQSLGMRRAFDDSLAEFGAMFDTPAKGFYISRVLQKARMSVTEWGTEAGAVTVVEMSEKSAGPMETVRFNADHPFVFIIGEKKSGAILFEGAFTGK